MTPCARLSDAVLSAIRLVDRWAAEVAALHSRGFIHGNLVAGAIEPVPDASPATSGPACLLGDGTLRERTPFCLRDAGGLRLSREIDAATRQLRRLGIAFDPRRIDLFQLGAVLCRLVAGHSADAYLNSPRVKTKVPQELWPVLDRALVEAREDSFKDIAEFRAKLARLVTQD